MLPTLSMEQQFIKKLTEVIETNLHNEDFGVSELAAELGMSRITLHRKVKSIIKKSVSEFIREARLKRAYDLLHQKTGTVSEIAFKTGFGSVAYFNRCFHSKYGFPPGEVLKGMHQPVKAELPKKSFKQKLLSNKFMIVLPATIVLAVVLTLLLHSLHFNSIEKSIAILPPVDNSPDKSNSYILEGFREELLIKLDAIDELSVVSSTTTDNYRNSNKNIKKIARELNVNYVVEISGQTIGGKTVIRVQLIETDTDRHLWSNPYSKEVNEDNIFDIQEEVALMVAKELKANISPKEKTQLANRVSNNPAAYNYYLRGLDYMHLYERDPQLDHICEAQLFFENAIALDSSFAEAYYRLASVYIHTLAFINNNQSNELFNVYLDSGLVMANKALACRINDVSQVYQLKSDYYLRKGMQEEAKQNFELAWQNKTKDYSYYLFLMNYNVYKDDFYEIAKNYFNYIELLPDSVPIDQVALQKVAMNFANAGFPETAKKYAQELFNQHHDTLRHLAFFSLLEFRLAEFESSIEKNLKLYAEDTLKLQVLGLLFNDYYHARDFESAFFWAKKFRKAEKEILEVNFPDPKIAHLYLLNGLPDSAEILFNLAIEQCYEQQNSNVPIAQGKVNFVRLAGIYSVKGENKKALEFIKLYADRKDMNWWVLTQLKIMPLYDNIRYEPEYVEFIKNMESLYLKQHEKVKKLLISKGMEPV